MKTELLQIRIDADTLTALQAHVIDVPELSVSQYVRIAIREQLARDQYGIVDVPTLATAQKNIVQMPQPNESRDPVIPKTSTGETLRERTERQRQEREAAKVAA